MVNMKWKPPASSRYGLAIFSPSTNVLLYFAFTVTLPHWPTPTFLSFTPCHFDINAWTLSIKTSLALLMSSIGLPSVSLFAISPLMEC